MDLQNHKSTAFLTLPINDDQPKLKPEVKFVEKPEEKSPEDEKADEEKNGEEGNENKRPDNSRAGSGDSKPFKASNGHNGHNGYNDGDDNDDDDDDDDGDLQKFVKRENRNLHERAVSNVRLLKEAQLERWKDSIMNFIEDSKALRAKEEQVT